jgi:hypothetical protein
MYSKLFQIMLFFENLQGYVRDRGRIEIRLRLRPKKMWMFAAPAPVPQHYIFLYMLFYLEHCGGRHIVV